MLSIYIDGIVELGRRKMRSKGIGQAKHSCDLCAIEAGTQDPDGYIQPLAWYRSDGLLRLFREIIEQLHHLMWRGIRVSIELASQRKCGLWVRTGCMSVGQLFQVTDHGVTVAITFYTM